MLKWFLKKEDIIKIFFISFLCSTVVFCLNMFPCEQENLEMAFIEARDGTTYTIDGEYHASVFFSTFILFLLIAVICHTFINDYETAKGYLFIRMKGACLWYRIKMSQSLFYCFYSQLIYNIALLIATCITGYKVQNVSTVIWYVVWGILSGTIILFLFVSAGNIFSLFFKPHLTVPTIVGICMAIMVGSCFLKDYEVRYSPLSCYCISWHIYQNQKALYLLPYPAWINYIFVSVIIMFMAIAGEAIIRKKDHI